MSQSHGMTGPHKHPRLPGKGFKSLPEGRLRGPRARQPSPASRRASSSSGWSACAKRSSRRVSRPTSWL